MVHNKDKMGGIEPKKKGEKKKREAKERKKRRKVKQRLEE